MPDITKINVGGTLYNVMDATAEHSSNKTIVIDGNSTDKQYPSAKAVYDLVANNSGDIVDIKSGNPLIVHNCTEGDEFGRITVSGNDIVGKNIRMSIWSEGNEKNLLPCPYYDGTTKTENGVTFTANIDGGVALSGTVSEEADADFILYDGTPEIFEAYLYFHLFFSLTGTGDMVTGSITFNAVMYKDGSIVKDINLNASGLRVDSESCDRVVIKLRVEHSAASYGDLSGNIAFPQVETGISYADSNYTRKSFASGTTATARTYEFTCTSPRFVIPYALTTENGRNMIMVYDPSVTVTLGVARDDAYTKAEVDEMFSSIPEHSSNKVTAIDESSTDDQYPSAKAVYDLVTGNSGGTEEPVPEPKSGNPLVFYDCTEGVPFETMSISGDIAGKTLVMSVWTNGNGKNLLPYPYYEGGDGTTKTENGITFTVYGDGSIGLSGAVSGESAYFTLYDGTPEIFDYVYLSTKLSNTNVRGVYMNIELYKDGSAISNENVTGGGKRITLETCDRVIIKLIVNVSVAASYGDLSGILAYPQIETGVTAATAYKQFAENANDYSIVVGSDKSSITIPLTIMQQEGKNMIMVHDPSATITLGAASDDGGTAIDAYTKAEVDEMFSSIDTYTKSEINTKIDNEITSALIQIGDQISQTGFNVVKLTADDFKQNGLWSDTGEETTEMSSRALYKETLKAGDYVCVYVNDKVNYGFRVHVWKDGVFQGSCDYYEDPYISTTNQSWRASLVFPILDPTYEIKIVVRKAGDADITLEEAANAITIVRK